jgi:hypothetical protein
MHVYTEKSVYPLKTISTRKVEDALVCNISR